MVAYKIDAQFVLKSNRNSYRLRFIEWLLCRQLMTLAIRGQ